MVLCRVTVRRSAFDSNIPDKVSIYKNAIFNLNILREAAKKVLFLVVGSQRKDFFAASLDNENICF